MGSTPSRIIKAGSLKGKGCRSAKYEVYKCVKIRVRITNTLLSKKPVMLRAPTSCRSSTSWHDNHMTCIILPRGIWGRFLLFTYCLAWSSLCRSNAVHIQMWARYSYRERIETLRSTVCTNTLVWLPIGVQRCRVCVQNWRSRVRIRAGTVTKSGVRNSGPSVGLNFPSI